MAAAAEHQHTHSSGAMSERMAVYMEEPLRGFVREMPRVLEAIGVAPGMHLADVGAGTGVTTEALARLVTRGGAPGQVFALDISPFFIHGLLSRSARLAESDPAAAAAIEVHSCSATDLGGNIPDSSLDLVILVDVAHHLSQPAELMRAIARALKAGMGRVAIIEHDRAKFMEAVARSHPREFLQLLEQNQHVPAGHHNHDAHAHGHAGHHHHHHHDAHAHAEKHNHHTPLTAPTLEAAAEPYADDVAAAVAKARELISKIPPLSLTAFSAIMLTAGLRLTSDLSSTIGIDDIHCLLIYTKS